MRTLSPELYEGIRILSFLAVSGHQGPRGLCGFRSADQAAGPTGRLSRCLRGCSSPEVTWGRGTIAPSDYFSPFHRASLIVPLVKNPPAMQETLVRFLGQEDLLEKATEPSVLGHPW